MQEITLPKNIKYKKESSSQGVFVIEGCYPGYGTTLGNALRRVLLSSLSGAAITSIKIKGAAHEFSTIPGVVEDAVQIILNLKRVRIKLHKESATITLSASGKKEVTAAAIKCPSDVEIINKETPVATLTSPKARLELEMEVTQGLGYVPVEQFNKEEKKIGVIDIDAIYTPVKRVNYSVENMRVGKRTDFDRLSVDVETDGTMNPKEAFAKAVNILISQFSSLKDVEDGDSQLETEVRDKEARAAMEENARKNVSASEADAEPVVALTIDQLKGLSKRTQNALENNSIKQVQELTVLTEDELKDLRGFGEKAVKEVKKAIGIHGLTLKQR